MPTSLFTDMERSADSLVEDRALQLALELSMLGMNNEADSSFSPTFESETRTKKSQNTTECVPVPSSEHVAEIVGRQGCKIKALRAKTNTYIKTPVRGEEPVFVVTGRKEDVNAAKREILSAAEHFSQIRAQRKNNLNGSLTPGPNSNVPGQTTIQVRVPYRVVGLVVGPKGATIKRIQQQTNTYIVTPSRDKEPVFEITGMPENVENARKEIEAHIAMRTGGIIDAPEDPEYSSADPAYSRGLSNGLVGSLYKTADLTSYGSYSRDAGILTPRTQETIFAFPSSTNSPGSTTTTAKLAELYTGSFPASFGTGYGLYDVDEGLGESPTFETPLVSLPPGSVWSDFGNSRSPTGGLFGTSTTTTTALRRSSLGNTPTTTLSDPILLDHPPARRLRSDPLTGSLSTLPPFAPLSNGNGSGAPNGILINSFSTSSSGGSGSVSSSPTESLTSARKCKRDCVVCFESEVVAALVPCGHNMFCLECANRICEKRDPECPVCRQQATQAIRIYS
ncbi:RNA-binding protein MEX3B-like isoform X1 [Centruroides sculpturatus]|uniref:RNA-binding protein MEX3B-like isoform X1 n=1 Tax=Centruroides sculpturatus TaxID=218467 RepID=UPI000C6D593C|nr:RNA-binding protein MEX3B-like isoform X1 [Centruroides sculpturatus]